jgi:enoyl-[acyl-carrier protein] reductase I
MTTRSRGASPSNWQTQGPNWHSPIRAKAFGRRVKPLAESRLEIAAAMRRGGHRHRGRVFERLKAEWGTIDFVVHAIGFSDKSELKGRYLDVTTRDNFSRTMVISAYSFTEVAQRARR